MPYMYDSVLFSDSIKTFGEINIYATIIFQEHFNVTFQ
jgi:hypothetical protein